MTIAAGETMALAALNLYRNIRGRHDLMRFLSRWDSDYRKDLIVTGLAFLILSYSIVTWDSPFDLVILALEASIIAVQMGTELSVLPRDYRPSYGGVRYTAQPSRHIAYDELSYLMSAVLPPKAEQELGLARPSASVADLCPERALVSSRIDDRLMLRPIIPWQRNAAAEEAGFIRSRHQIRYIAIRVADRKQHTTNGEKLAFDGLADDLARDEGVLQVRKSWYFDALLTAEAFRSRIFRNNIKGEKEVYTDLTTYFPVTLDIVDGEEYLRLTSDFYRKVSGHIGITTLLLTENRRIAMLTQGTTKAIGASTVTLGGSGSMDYADILRAGNPKDFREVVATAMARELCEETGMQSWFPQVLKNTLVTGFFRWVDRCGKPEFVGITHARDVPFSARRAIDGDEVVGFEEIPVTITAPADFATALDYVAQNKIPLALSSLMALQRLVTIAAYAQNSDEDRQAAAVHEKLRGFLSFYGQKAA